LAIVSGINLAGFVVELAGGLAFGSVALVSDAFNMLFDALAYVMAFAAAYVADRYGDNDRWSYGLHRLEPLAAFLNYAVARSPLPQARAKRAVGRGGARS
jgi:cobalt-zinc-cadmium efflux system protein